MKAISAALAISTVLLACGAASSQQTIDANADVRVARPAFARGTGPVLAIDAGHHEMGSIAGSYGPMAALAQNDGYRLVSFDKAFAAPALEGVDIVTIANARPRPPFDPAQPGSAFDPTEIEALHAWVEGGGALLLVADHMPFGGSAQALAQRFGVQFENSFAMPPTQGPETFSTGNGRLVEGPVSRGAEPGEAVRGVQYFMGTVLHAPAEATPLLRLGKGWSIVLPAQPWKFDGAPRRASNADDLRGAALQVGRGRVVVLSEAAMLTAQIDGRGGKAGFNAKGAEGNRQYVLNILHWLSGRPG